MKAFWFSAGVLVLMIVAILCNSFYVKSVTSELESALTNMQICNLTESTALQERWYDEGKMLELSISTNDMNEVSTRLSELCTAASFNDEEAFKRAQALCLDGIARIRDLERFSILHIL